MKKIATGFFVLAMAASFAIQAFAAAPLFVEDFNYTAPSGLAGQGGWAAHSGAGTNPQTVNTPGLTYLGYPSSGIGNLLGPLATSGEDTNHGFTAVTAGSVYAALMVNEVSAQTAGDYFFHFFDGPIASNLFRARIFVKKDASTTNYAFGLQSSSAAGSLVYTPFIYAPGSTHLLVLKYTYNPNVAPAAPDDAVSLFIDPVVGCTEPAATLTTVTTTLEIDAISIDGVAIRQGSAANAASVKVDGIRVANNWGDAVSICGGSPTHSSSWGQIKSLYR